VDVGPFIAMGFGGDSAREIDPGGDSPSPRSPPLRLILRGTDAQPLLIGRVGIER
jgi:hypothetical protein